MTKNIPDLFDIFIFKLLFGIVIGIPIVGSGVYFGITGIVPLFVLVALVVFEEPSLIYDFEYTLKTIKFIFPFAINCFLGISGFIGVCGIAVRIHKTYKKLPNNHVQTIRFMLFCGLYACLGAIGAVLLFIGFENLKVTSTILVFFIFSFLVFTFCLRATPKRL